jgi:hypothetical protein
MTPVCEPVTQQDGHPDLHFRNGGADGPDARLIAAAPDLLAELCKAADTFADTARYFSLLGKSEGAEVFRIAETAARSLIAKATEAAS